MGKTTKNKSNYKTDKGAENNLGILDIFKIIGLIAGTVTIAGILVNLGRCLQKLDTVEETVKNNGSRLVTLETKVTELETIHKYQRGEVAKETYELGDAIPIKAEGEMASVIRTSLASSCKEVDMLPMSWSSNEVVAYGIDGTEYKAENLYDKPIILAYEEGNQEVFFYGSIDSDSRWNGPCLVNVYAGDDFIIATEAHYECGIREAYSQLFAVDNSWNYSERIDEDKMCSGDTWRFVKTGEIKRIISYEDPTVDGMINPKAFISQIPTGLLAHYHGNTKNGKYNDNTGNAYLVRYFEDGTVQTLYKGMFVDGQFYDESGNAWYITKDKTTGYMYYKGIFKNNHPIDPKLRTEKDVFMDSVELEFAEQLISGEPFRNEICWDYFGLVNQVKPDEEF